MDKAEALAYVSRLDAAMRPLLSGVMPCCNMSQCSRKAQGVKTATASRSLTNVNAMYVPIAKINIASIAKPSADNVFLSFNRRTLPSVLCSVGLQPSP